MAKFDLTPELIASVYETALDPDGLRQMALLIGKLLDAESTGIWFVKDGQVSDLTLSNDLIESQKPYMAYYHKVDVWQADAVMRLDHAVLGSESVAHKDLVRTEFYNDFARRFDFTNPMGAAIGLEPNATASIALDRMSSRLRFTEASKLPFQLLIPHVKRALQLRLHVRPAHAAAPPSLGLDMLSFGALVCDRSARIVYANEAAEALAVAATSLVFKLKDRTLGAVVAAESARLVKLVHDAATMSTSGSLVLTSRDGVPTLMVLVTPLPGSAIADLGRGYAMIAVRDVDAAPSFGVKRLIELFRLSPAQAGLAVGLYEGKSFEEIAIERGVKISTLRTHFAEVLNRTGAKGLRDLVRLLGLIPPLR